VCVGAGMAAWVGAGGFVGTSVLVAGGAAGVAVSGTTASVGEATTVSKGKGGSGVGVPISWAPAGLPAAMDNRNIPHSAHNTHAVRRAFPVVRDLPGMDWSGADCK
jgi:hypothetical protein